MEEHKLKNNREGLLSPLRQPRTFVSYLPYLEGEKDRRFRANVFTTLDYTVEQIAAAENTDGALAFVERYLSELKPDDKSAIWLGYLIDSRYRTEKNFKPALEASDILEGLHTVTIGGSYATKTNETNFRRETFVVRLDEFLEGLSTLNCTVNACLTSRELIDTLVSFGPDASPRLEFTAKTFKFNELESRSIGKI